MHGKDGKVKSMKLCHIIAMILLLISLASAVTECANITVSGEYSLENSVNISGATCFNISASNVVLDCAGFSIVGSNTTNTFGAYSNRPNTTIRNCVIANFSYDIGFNNADNGTIENDNVSSDFVGNGGILLTGGSTGNVVNNCIASIPKGIGIYINASANNNISNSFANTTTSYGILAASSPNSMIVNSTGMTGTGVGIYIYTDSDGSTVLDSAGIATSSGNGFYLYSNEFINLTRANGTSVSGKGIQIRASTDFLLDSSNGTSGSGIGVYVYQGSNPGNIANTTMVSNSGYGISVTDSTINITDSSSASTSNYSMVVDGLSYNSVIRRTTSTSSSGSGIYCVTGMNRLTLIDSNFSSTSGSGIYLYGCDHVNIINVDTSSNSSYGLYARSNSDNMIITNVTSSSNSSSGAYIYSGMGNITINNLTGTSNGAGNGIYINSATTCRINGSNGTSVNGSGILLLDTTNSNITDSVFTSGNGYALQFRGGQNNKITNSNVSSGQTGILISDSPYSNISGILIEGGTYGIIINDTYDSNLSNLHVNNTSVIGIYVTNDSHGNNFTGIDMNTLDGHGIFLLSGVDTTFDCEGSAINGKNETGNYGIYSQVKTAIRNCNVSNFSTGVYLNTADDSTVDNVNVSVSYLGIILPDGAGVYVYSNANNNTLTNIKAMSEIGIGVVISSSKGNILANSTGISGTLSGVYLYLSNQTAISDVNGSSNSGYGLYIATSFLNNITRFIGVSNTSHGIRMASSANNIILDSNGASTGGEGISLSGSTDNNLTNVTGSSNGNSGIRFESASGRNRIVNSTGTSNISYGIYFTSSGLNNITNCRGTSNTGNGMASAAGSNGNNFTDSNGTSGTGYGIYLNYETYYNNFVNCIGASNSGYGIYFLTRTDFNRFTNCTGTANTSTGVGIHLRTCSRNNFTDTSGISPSGYGIYLYDTFNNTFEGGAGISSSRDGVYVLSSNNNTFIGTSGMSGSAYGVDVSASHNTTLSGMNISSNSTAGALMENSYSAILANSQISGRHATYGAALLKNINSSIVANNTMDGGGRNNSLNITNSKGNSVHNNTLKNATTLLRVDSLSFNNTFYWNNFTDTAGYYVNDTNGTNSYNTTVDGKNEGNLWHNIMNGSIVATGETASGYGIGFYIGDDGDGVPYNITSSAGKFQCNFEACADNAPITTSSFRLGSLIVTAGDGGSASGSDYNFILPANKTVIASANAGYTFTNWTLGGNCTIENVSATTTNITINGGVCTALASFNYTSVLDACQYTFQGRGANIDGDLALNITLNGALAYNHTFTNAVVNGTWFEIVEFKTTIPNQPYMLSYAINGTWFVFPDTGTAEHGIGAYKVCPDVISIPANDNVSQKMCLNVSQTGTVSAYRC